MNILDQIFQGGIYLREHSQTLERERAIVILIIQAPRYLKKIYSKKSPFQLETVFRN